jgi:hypothetical protein
MRETLLMGLMAVLLLATPLVMRMCLAEPQAFDPNNTGSARILTEEEAKAKQFTGGATGTITLEEHLEPSTPTLTDNNEWFINQVPEPKIYLEFRPDEDSNVKTSWTAKNVYIDLDFLSEVLESGQYTKEQLMVLRDRIDKYLAKETLVDK